MSNKFFKNRFLKISFKILLYIFGAIGFFLTSAFFAVKLHLTNDPGTVDKNDRYFQEMSAKNYSDKNNNPKGLDSIYDYTKENAILYYKIGIINKYYPKNANLLLHSFNCCKNPAMIEKMIDALNLQVQDNKEYLNKLSDAKNLFADEKKQQCKDNVVPWMNMPEWEIFKQACVKDKALIDSAANAVGVEPRLVASMLVGEQIRLFNSQREMYKKAIEPLKILSVETKFSLGVTGIKDETAVKVERFLKDKDSDFYLGPDYESIISYSRQDSSQERFERLTSYKNHYYSYLYAALIIKQIKVQWERAGYDLSERPEIIATLYNLGFEVSKPKENPQVGGSRIWLKNVMYTFGVISFDFYYSGELIKEFPYWDKKWS